MVGKDVKEICKVIGVKFKGISNNSFNVFSRVGRIEWQVTGGDVNGE